MYNNYIYIYIIIFSKKPTYLQYRCILYRASKSNAKAKEFLYELNFLKKVLDNSFNENDITVQGQHLTEKLRLIQANPISIRPVSADLQDPSCKSHQGRLSKKRLYPT